jgi:asparagine synthase (glutamine-hydrolysing)
MCGIAGFLDLRSQARDPAAARAQLTAMTESIRYRGPDGEGHWIDGPVALGHRRLSIVDLSPAGAQPMTSASGRFVITYNGEIYNHAALRRALEPAGVAWRGNSDTEVLLAAFDTWGIEATLHECVGMFAFALWDRREQRLTLARDRLGEKPLYFGWQGGVFLFGSELKALRAHPAFQASVAPSAVADLVRWGYVPAPRSIFDGIEKLCAAEIAHLDLADPANHILRRQRYWRVEEEVARGLEQPFRGSLDDAADALHQLLIDAVALQRQADVPVGAFLSGGIDSSLVVALMQRQSSQPLRSFSIGFTEAEFDESAHARHVAQHLGTEHHEMLVTPTQALAAIPQLPQMFDEPLGDASQIPTHLVAQLARQHVTVSVSGDGGDELFGGYAKYAVGSRLASTPMRHALGHLATSPLGRLGALAAARVPGLASRLRPERVQRAGRLLCSTKADIAQDLCDLAPGVQLVSALTARPLWRAAAPAVLEGASYGATAALLDMLSFLPEDVLVKVDRASMAVSLESRAPLLDHRVAQLAFSLPWSYRGGTGNDKRVLRHLLYRLVPRPLVDRPKMGFSLPINRWLRRELRPWAEALINDEIGRQNGVLDGPKLRSIWNGHLNGHADRSGVLWPVLMYLAWRR